jgi:hypothetical protein
VVVWLLLATLFAAWSMTTPLFASPDESAQVSKAAAVSRGQLVGTTVQQPGTYFPIITQVQLPSYYAEGLDNADCYLGDTSEPASCAPAFDADDESTGEVQTWIGRYPPLYYAVVGLPSLVSDGSAAVYAMRLVAAAVCAAVYALGLTALRTSGWPRLLQAGGLLAITPSAAFFAGVVNSSGLEIAAGFATWCLLGPLVVSPSSHRVRRRLLAGSVTAAVLLNTRPGSGLLLVLVLVCLAVLSRAEFWRSVLSRGRWVPAVVVGAVAAVAAGAWLLVVDPTASLGGIPDPAFADPVVAVEGAAALSGRYLAEQLAVFGSLNVTLQPLLLVLLGVTVGSTVAVALVVARGGRRWGLLALLALTFVLPILAQVPSAADLGLIWQGRYGLPLSIGLPVVSVVVIASAGRRRLRVCEAAPLVLIAVFALIQSVALLWSLRRYAIGFGRPLLSGTIEWLPPGGWSWVVVGCIAPVALSAVVVADTRRRGPRSDPSEPLAVGPRADTTTASTTMEK